MASIPVEGTHPSTASPEVMAVLTADVADHDGMLILLERLALAAPIATVIASLREHGYDIVAEQIPIDWTGPSAAPALPVFLEWVLAFDKGQRLRNYLNHLCPHIALIEQGSDYSFRYRIWTDDDTLQSSNREERKGQGEDQALRPSDPFTLSTLFLALERERDKLELQDYSVGMASLDQIFNQFAAED